eukprot:SAG31_NODE_608_length_13576_cov_23.757290_3_plen_59_part_00
MTKARLTVFPLPFYFQENLLSILDSEAIASVRLGEVALLLLLSLRELALLPSSNLCRS